MHPPRRLRILTKSELGHLTAARLLAYRKKALSLENTLADSDYRDSAGMPDETFIWFKEDPRWQSVYDDILAELSQKQSGDRIKSPVQDKLRAEAGAAPDLARDTGSGSS